MTYKRCILFLCTLFLAVHANGHAEPKAPSHNKSPNPLVFPKELAQKSLTEELLDRTTVARQQIILQESKDAPRAKFIWEVAKVENKIRLDELTFHFEAEQKKESQRESFSITLRYEDGDLIVIHSKPSNPQFKNGVKSVISEEDKSRWGGFIHGREVPGALFITPQTREKSEFPILLCPRYGIQQNGALVIQGKDPKAALVSVSGRLTGGIHVEFPTSYTAGSGSVRYTSLRALEPEIREGMIIQNDPSFSFLYRASKTMLETSPEKNGETPIGILSDVLLTNPAGYKAQIHLSAVTWIHELTPNPSQSFRFMQQGKVRQEELGPGMCLHIFPAEQRTIKYSNPREKES